MDIYIYIYMDIYIYIYMYDVPYYLIWWIHHIGYLGTSIRSTKLPYVVDLLDP